MDSGTAALGLSAAQFLEHTCPTCTGPDASELVDSLVARLQQACVKSLWCSSLETRSQTTLQPVSHGPVLHESLCSCQDDCLAAVARFISDATHMSCTSAADSLASVTSCTEASTVEHQNCECSTTVLLRAAVLLAQMSSCIPASYNGGHAESISWTCLMRLSVLLRRCVESDSSPEVTLEEKGLINILLWTLSPVLLQAADKPKQQAAGRTACSIFRGICSLGLAHQSHVATFLLQSGTHGACRYA